MSTRKANSPSPTPKVVAHEEKPADKIAWLLSAGAALAYYAYSFKSTGYYQHDEIAHLLNMYEFWDDPSKILGNWPKTGYKLAYALPSLLGTKFLLVLNCLLAGLTCFIVYKTTALFNRRYALLALIFLAAQPMWTEISFRNYADSFSGLVLIGAVYFHYRGKFIPASLLLSYSTLVRQEFFLIAIPYGIYLLYKQRWVSAFLLATFPLLYNLWGGILTNDPLYLYTSTKETSSLYSEQFGKHGFFHFFRMSMIVWGAVPVILAVVFMGQVVMNGIAKNLAIVFGRNPVFIWLPALIYLLIHSLFNYEGLNLGASPNLRYMNAIAPLIAVMAALALSAWPQVKAKPLPYALIAGAALLFYMIFATYDHNGVVLLEDKKDYKLFFIALLAFILLFLNLKSSAQLYAFGAMSLIAGILAIKPKKPGNEDLAVKNMVSWIVKNNKDQAQIFTNHSVVSFFYEKERGHIPKDLHSLDSAAITNAPAGSIVIIESHYSLRLDFPAPAEYIRNEYLQGRDFSKAINNFANLHQGRYVVANQFIAKDQSFGAIVFEKVK